ncbi:MAG: polysaccharide deacetylase family protein [Actinobacteria bacterium]|nr:polysaccharide deacetylase family protein [Actinomycetota bacterium]
MSEERGGTRVDSASRNARRRVSPARSRSRRTRKRLKFTRRFYILVGSLGLSVLVVILVAALASSGGGGDFQEKLAGTVGLMESELHRLKVNELGAVMILEYHRIAEEGRWSRTPENFRSDLAYLYEQGYRCISLKDLVTNNISVPAGYTPLVITFDDSDPSQFRYIEENGELVIDPRCAVGVMEEFSREHPDFNMTATFYVLPVLFGQEEYAETKLAYLVEHGYDIGNHTMNHVSLGEASTETILKELSGNIAMVQRYLPAYQQTSIALPNGSEPKDYNVLRYGDYEGVKIDFLASLLVGANPAPAPCDRSFDPLRLPRIQALDPSLDTGDCGLYAWVQYFMENPERRYVSDGDPTTVTIPKHMEERVDKEKLGNKRLRTY